jgi:ribonuclease BN (tRNA processing enzyme)
MSNKISEENFSKLQEIKNEAVEIASLLGELEYQKISTELKIDEQRHKIKILKLKEFELFEEIRKLHGNVVINIETGTFTPQVEEVDATEE